MKVQFLRSIRITRAAAVLAGLMLLGGPALATYLRPDLENVPVEKLVANIQKVVDNKPKDAAVRLNLARVHAMAYALKTDSTQVRKVKGELENQAWFGYEPRHVPFVAKPTDDADKKKAAKEHLDKAIALYKEAVKLAPDNLTARLGLAWCLDQAKETKEAIKAYRDVIEDAWKKEKDLKAAPLGWHSVTAEAAGYLIPLLDAKTDENEIKTLKERGEQMQKVPRPITPIVVPLRDGLSARDLEDRAARVRFDADGTGLKQQWTWITKDAAWLVYDQRGDKQITSALQLFGNVTFWLFWENGYQALAALDADGDGLLTGKELEHLALWHDANGDGICDPGEVKSLAEWGIVAVSCRFEIDSRHPDRIAFSPRGVIFRDGNARPTFDIMLRRR